MNRPQDLLVIERVTDAKELERVSKFVYDRYRSAFRSNDWDWDYERDIRSQDAAYDANSFVIVARQRGQLLGCMKLISPSSGQKLPIEKDFELDCNRLTSAMCNLDSRTPVYFEVARFAVILEAKTKRGNWNGHEVSLSLIREAILTSELRGVDAWFASLDVNVLRWLRSLGMHFETIGDPKMYIGSPTTPTMLTRARARDGIREANHALWEFIYG